MTHHCSDATLFAVVDSIMTLSTVIQSIGLVDDKYDPLVELRYIVTERKLLLFESGIVSARSLLVYCRSMVTSVDIVPECRIKRCHNMQAWWTGDQELVAVW